MGAQNNKGWIALMLAAQNGHEQVARVLLEAGAVVIAQTNDGTTALMLAAHNGHEQVATVGYCLRQVLIGTRIRLVE